MSNRVLDYVAPAVITAAWTAARDYDATPARRRVIRTGVLLSAAALGSRLGAPAPTSSADPAATSANPTVATSSGGDSPDPTVAAWSGSGSPGGPGGLMAAGANSPDGPGGLMAAGPTSPSRPGRAAATPAMLITGLVASFALPYGWSLVQRRLIATLARHGVRRPALLLGAVEGVVLTTLQYTTDRLEPPAEPSSAPPGGPPTPPVSQSDPGP